MMRLTKNIIFCSAMLAAVTLSAENLIFNAGFELGDAGFGSWRYLRQSTNPTMNYVRPGIDVSTFTSGRQSLHLVNPYSEHVTLFTREFRLEPGTQYSGSLNLKSTSANYPVRVRILSFSTAKSNWGYDYSKEVQAGTDWRRFDFSFKSADTGKACEYYVLMLETCRAPNAVGADLWVDDLQLDRTDSAASSVSTGIEAAVSVDRRLQIFQTAKPAAANVSVALLNHTSSVANSKVTLKILSESDGSVIFSRDFTVTLRPGVPERVSCPVPLTRYDAYRAVADVSAPSGLSVASQPSLFAAVGPYEQKVIDTDRDFCLSFNAALGQVSPPRWGQVDKPGVLASGSSPDEHAALLAAAGCRLLRVGCDFKWCDLEPREGVNDFADFDRELALASSYGIELMPILGTWLGHSDPSINPVPGWLKPRCVKRSVWPYNNRPQTESAMPPEDAWRKHVRTVAERYKGRIKHYEIINEPNADYFPAEYLVYLKSAQEEIRTADPNCKIVGFCSSGDYGLPAGAFLEECAKLGGLAFADIVSYHPYETPKVPEANILNLACMDILRKYAPERSIPLWNTELFFLTGKGSTPYDKGIYAPCDLAQRFLTDLGDGLGQSINIEETSLWSRELAPHLKDSFGAERIPSDKYVAANALARLFEGAKPMAKIGWSDNSIGYVYERNGKPLAALWSWGKQSDLTLKLNHPPAGLLLYDLFGNPLPAPADGVLQLSPSPLYLTFDAPGMTAAEFTAVLKDASAEFACPISCGTQSRLVPALSGWTLPVPCQNISGRGLSGELTLSGPALTAPVVVPFKLPALTESSIPVPVQPGKELSGGLTVRFAVNGKSWEFPLAVASAGKIIRPGSPVEFGPVVIESTVAGDVLKLIFAVRDATPSGPPAGRQPWNQDCLEIFLDAAPLQNAVKQPEAYHDRVARLFILPDAPANEQLLIQPGQLKLDTARVAVSRNSDGYTAVLTLPLAAFDGPVLGFDVQVDDGNTAKRLSSACWNAPGDAYKNRLHFGFIVLD